jgi:WD40 repeat protein
MKKIMGLLVLLMLAGSAVAMQAPDAGKTLKLHTGKVNSVTFNNEKTILTGSADGSVKVTQISGETNFNKAGLGNVIGAFLHDNKTYLAVASDAVKGPQFYPLTVAGSATNRGEVKPVLHKALVTRILALNDTATVTGALDGSLVAIFKDGKMVQMNAGGPIVSLAKAGYAPNNTRFLAITNNGNLLWFDTQAGRAIYSEPAPGATAVGWVGEANANQARWAVGYSNGQIQILDSIKGGGAPVRSYLKGHTGGITALTGFKDPYLISGSADGTVRLWDASTGQELKSFNVGKPVASVAAIANAQNGISIAAGLNDGSVYVYEYNVNAPAQEEVLEAR